MVMNGLRTLRVLPLTLPFLLCLHSGLTNVCLPGGIQQSELKEVGAGEESYAIGFWVNDWNAGHLAVAVVQILIQEILGYKVELKGPGPLALQGFFALTGCTSPTNSSNRGCGPSKTYTHINIEVWTDVYRGSWDEIQMKYPDMAPKNLGHSGYYGVTAMYVPSAVQETAYEAEGINLDFYREYNATRKNPSQYFASPGDVDVSQLLRCTDSALMLDEVMSNYLSITGDTAGVVVGAAGVTGKCFEEYFWFAPACRHLSSTCFIWFTGGQGWGMYEMLVKATTYNMPLATAVASSFSNYGKLPLTQNMMLYWWVPDPTFLRLKPRRIVFPEHKADEWAKGDRRSASRDVSIEKHVSQDLHTLAPEVEELIAKLSMSLDTVEELMVDQMNTEDSNFDVACRWLRSHEAKWSEWLPEKGKCFSQFGIYDERNGVFLKTRDDVATITCRACPSGFFSERLQDTQGVTFICKECDRGSAQASGASVACEPCPLGQYTNETASLSCEVCSVDHYQDQLGGHLCKRCPKGTGTRLLGSVSVSDCGCYEGSINIAASGATGASQCVHCGEGLDCPFASTLENLKSAVSPKKRSAAQEVPRVLPGYYATMEEPLEIFHCRPQSSCPGGAPGRCAKGLIDKLCAVCPEGQALAGGECADCGPVAVGLAFGLLILVLLGVAVAYYVTNVEVRSQATPFKSVLMTFTLAAGALQLLAMLGLMSVVFPPTVQSSTSSLKFLVLDLDDLVILSCVTGGSPMTSYVMSMSMFPAGVAWLWLCYLASFWLPKLTPWKPAFTVNTIGGGLLTSYGTMAAVALKPFMCYKHPNGQHSLVSYPAIFCGEGEHSSMLILAILLLVFVVGFFALCGYACWNVSNWCIDGQTRKVQSFRFSISNFRVDSYWFILAVLLRGFSFALSVVIGTNNPPVQTALASVILTIYGIAVTKMRPWKARVVNFADTIVTACFLLLVSKAIQVDKDVEAPFAETSTIVLLLFILSTLVLATACSLLALLRQHLGAEWMAFLAFGKAFQVNSIAQDIKQCADLLNGIEIPELATKIAKMNVYDLQNMENFIEIILELQTPGHAPSIRRSGSLVSSKNRRVNVTVINETIDDELLGDGDEHAGGGDGNTIAADCKAEVVKDSSADVDESAETQPAIDSRSNEDSSIMIGNIVRTEC